MKYYAGIGSRETPDEVLDMFIKVGEYMAKKGFTLRSGGAAGADISFEIGCNNADGAKEIYLPWKGFQDSKSALVVKDLRAFEIAKEYHPYWSNLAQGAQKLQARNSHQVLGLDLASPSEFIICWTRNGDGSGGTGQAIRIAKAFNVAVFDAGKYDDISECKIKIKEFLDGFC